LKMLKNNAREQLPLLLHQALSQLLPYYER
jgi:hypothetical protein